MRFVGCGGGRQKVREEGLWRKYCVGEGKGEEKGGVRLMGGRVVVLQGDTALRECILDNDSYQER